jgi:hypothetical protein
MKSYKEVRGAWLTPQGLGNRRFLDNHGFVRGVVKTDDLSLLTGLSLSSTKPTDVSLSYKNLCLCTFFLNANRDYPIPYWRINGAV